MPQLMNGGGNKKRITGWVNDLLFVLVIKRVRDVESKAVFFICCLLCMGPVDFPTNYEGGLSQTSSSTTIQIQTKMREYNSENFSC